MAKKPLIKSAKITEPMTAIIAMSDHQLHSEGMAEMLKMATANLAECKDQAERLAEAERVLCSMSRAILDEDRLAVQLAFLRACHNAWKQYLEGYMALADLHGDEWLPSPHWPIEAFAHEFSGKIAIGHPVIVKCFMAFGFGHPAEWLRAKSQTSHKGLHMAELPLYGVEYA